MSRRFALIVGLLVVATAVWLLRPISIVDRDPAALYHQMVALRNAMRDFKQEYETFPTGTYAEIVAKLAGDNRRQIKFLSVEMFHLNREGVYSDTWGTPLRIEVSNDTVVVSSAGPDKTFGTVDDVLMDGTEPDNSIQRTGLTPRR